MADIFRLEDGKLVEHWDVLQPVQRPQPTTTRCSEAHPPAQSRTGRAPRPPERVRPARPPRRSGKAGRHPSPQNMNVSKPYPTARSVAHRPTGRPDRAAAEAGAVGDLAVHIEYASDLRRIAACLDSSIIEAGRALLTRVIPSQDGTHPSASRPRSRSAPGPYTPSQIPMGWTGTGRSALRPGGSARPRSAGCARRSRSAE